MSESIFNLETSSSVYSWIYIIYSRSTAVGLQEPEIEPINDCIDVLGVYIFPSVCIPVPVVGRRRRDIAFS